MKDLIFKFWIVNLLFTIGLFCLYRTFFMDTKPSNGNTFDEFMNLIYLVLNMHFVLFYLFAMFICSLTFFLNLNSRIRKNPLLSLLSFIGIPTAVVLHFVIDFMTDMYSQKPFPEYQSGMTDFFVNFISFPVFYLVLVITEFIVFRKKIQKYELEANTQTSIRNI